MSTARFTYSGSQDMYPDLFARSGQTVEIVRPITTDEADLDETGPMSRIRFADGFEHDAFADELEPQA